MPWLDTNLQNPALRPLAERLVSELRLGDDHTDAVEMLLANLQQAGQEPLLFRRAADAYSPNRYQRFDRHHILSPLWRMRGRHIGESKASAGHAPTAQALPLLQSRLSRIEATAVFAEPIILRSEKLWSEKRAARVAAGIDYEDTDETNRMREGLRRYNDVMAQHRVCHRPKTLDPSGQDLQPGELRPRRSVLSSKLPAAQQARPRQVDDRWRTGGRAGLRLDAPDDALSALGP